MKRRARGGGGGKPASPRIVSLLASGTEAVCALGLEEHLVGISHECDWPPRILDRPRVSRPRFDPSGMTSGEVDEAVRRVMAEHGFVYEVDGAAVEGLDPELILAQAVCEVCAVPTEGARRVVEERGLAASIVSLDAHTLEEILGSVVAVGEAAGVAVRAREVVAGLRERLESVRRAVAGATRPRVLGIEWLDPPFVPGHWVPEMIELAGGGCAAGRPGLPSRETTWEELGELDPDVLIVMPCGYGLAAARAESDRFARRLRTVAGRAIETGRAFVVDGSSYFNRSGPRVVDGVEILAGLLHPDRVAPPAAAAAGAWSPERS